MIKQTVLTRHHSIKGLIKRKKKMKINYSYFLISSVQRI